MLQSILIRLIDWVSKAVSFINTYSYFFFTALILPFIIVNGLSFEGDTIRFIPSEAFSFSSVLDYDKVKLYLSMIPAFTLTVAYISWNSNSTLQRVADINGLLEELRHNINLCDAYCQITDPRAFYNHIYRALNQFSSYAEYPTDMNSQPALMHHVTAQSLNPSFGYIKLRNDFITSAISSKSYFHLKRHRVFLNLGHLNFSILRHNLNVNSHNTNQTAVSANFLQQEYLYWLHYRLHFMLVDLIKSVHKRDIIDKNYMNTMTAYFS